MSAHSCICCCCCCCRCCVCPIAPARDGILCVLALPRVRIQRKQACWHARSRGRAKAAAHLGPRRRCLCLGLLEEFLQLLHLGALSSRGLRRNSLHAGSSGQCLQACEHTCMHVCAHAYVCARVCAIEAFKMSRTFRLIERATKGRALQASCRHTLLRQGCAHLDWRACSCRILGGGCPQNARASWHHHGPTRASWHHHGQSIPAPSWPNKSILAPSWPEHPGTIMAQQEHPGTIMARGSWHHHGSTRGLSYTQAHLAAPGASVPAATSATGPAQGAAGVESRGRGGRARRLRPQCHRSPPLHKASKRCKSTCRHRPRVRLDSLLEHGARPWRTCRCAQLSERLHFHGWDIFGARARACKCRLSLALRTCAASCPQGRFCPGLKQRAATT